MNDAERTGDVKASHSRCADTSRHDRLKQRIKFVVFSLLPAAALVLFIEFSVWVFGLDLPSMRSPFLTQEFDAIHQDDDELFFSLRPNLNRRWQGTTVVTNSRGLRSAEIGPKKTREFRILSLGESTTFGAFVENDQTYSVMLESELQRRDRSRTYRVINAGVSAYSSFQSLKFLELRGLSLEPDMVLFYHEVNDFLPTTIRESATGGDSSLALTDRQLYMSKQRTLHRNLYSLSAIYRAAYNYRSRRQLDRFRRDEQQRSTDRLIPDSFRTVETREGVRHLELPTRVPVEDRKENFRLLKTFCDQHGIRLVILHPSYLESTRHECELTEFCRASGVPMFEVYDSLHPPTADPHDYFLDHAHPTVLGHRTIAQNLAEYLLQAKLVPASN